jgi:hypothetical protein
MYPPTDTLSHHRIASVVRTQMFGGVYGNSGRGAFGFASPPEIAMSNTSQILATHKQIIALQSQLAQSATNCEIAERARARVYEDLDSAKCRVADVEKQAAAIKGKGGVVEADLVTKHVTEMREAVEAVSHQRQRVAEHDKSVEAAYTERQQVNQGLTEAQRRYDAFPFYERWQAHIDDVSVPIAGGITAIFAAMALFDWDWHWLAVIIVGLLAFGALNKLLENLVWLTIAAASIVGVIVLLSAMT